MVIISVWTEIGGSFMNIQNYATTDFILSFRTEYSKTRSFKFLIKFLSSVSSRDSANADDVIMIHRCECFRVFKCYV